MGYYDKHQVSECELNLDYCLLSNNLRHEHRSKESLVKFLTPFKAQLSADSQVRLEKNPMRILDSKDEGVKVSSRSK